MPQRIRRLGHAMALPLLLAVLAPIGVQAQERVHTQPIDEAYTALIHEFTTEDFFLTPLVDHLPASETVPTPLDHLGVIAGTRNVLHHTHEIYSYLEAVAAASPRARLVTIGQDEEGSDILLMIISDEATLNELDTHKELMARLADPRGTSEAEAAEIISTVKPMYWATGAIHPSETGSPQMLMELAYRLVVDESDLIRDIRDNLIVMITPIVSPDGHNKVVDVHMAPRVNPDGPNPTRTIYWGKYVYHSANRDGMALSLNLSNAVVQTYLEYHPLVVHDLHESASYLYTSTGRGPYNAWIDPITISEWNRLAHREVQDMGAFGVPGVYTGDFYDGWGPNYMFWVAHIHNSIGRFYETQAGRDASDYVLRTNVDRAWHRPNTPLPEVVWSIRNNVNLQQSAILIAMNEVAVERQYYLQNFWTKSKRSVAKARMEGPAAYVFPGDDPRLGQQARVLELLQRHGMEVHRLTSAATVEEQTFPAGSYVVRMDQPYSRGADMLLDLQHYSPNDPRPYDDVGWTFGPLFNAQTVRIEDPEILSAPMNLVGERVHPAGRVLEADAGSTAAYLINFNADNNLTAFRFAHPDLEIHAARSGFEAAGRSFRPGTFILRTDGNARDLGSTLEAAAREYGFEAVAVESVPSVGTHPVAFPRVAVVHTWLTTQNEGWVRIGLDEYGIPYDYVSVHEVRDTPNLGSRWDVIIMGPSVTDPMALLHGVQGDDPIPWQASEHTPHIGRQSSSPDIRGGLELQGVMHLKRFVEEGGTLLTIGSSNVLPIHFGIATGVTLREPQNLWAPGGVFRATLADTGSPLAWGYDEELGVYFNVGHGPVLDDRRPRPGSRVAQEPDGSTTTRLSGRGGPLDRDQPQVRGRDWGQEGVRAFLEEHGEGAGGGGGWWQASAGAGDNVRTIFRFHQEPTQLLISGGLVNPRELVSSPAMVDVRVGEGHVVMFTINPMWRSGTLGSYSLVFNALLHHGNLDAGAPVAEEDVDDADL